MLQCLSVVLEPLFVAHTPRGTGGIWALAVNVRELCISGISLDFCLRAILTFRLDVAFQAPEIFLRLTSGVCVEPAHFGPDASPSFQALVSMYALLLALPACS